MMRPFAGYYRPTKNLPRVLRIARTGGWGHGLYLCTRRRGWYVVVGHPPKWGRRA